MLTGLIVATQNTLVIPTASATAFCNQTTTAGANGSVTTAKDGNFCYVAFRNTGALSTQVNFTWTKPAEVSAIDILVVAGGGGGGSRHAGGGGAGGVIKSSAVTLQDITSLSITVGTGGAGATGRNDSGMANGTTGQDSIVQKSTGSGSLTTLTAKGGGYGGFTGAVGGSGGGSYSGNISGTANQGNAGGSGGAAAVDGAGFDNVWFGGGGGGAGSNGANGTTSVGGVGGAGTTWVADFTSSIATTLGLTSTTFGGGGGGGITHASLSRIGGNGGTGGGGAGGGTAAGSGPNGATGVSGTAYTGGGGGGSGLQQGQNNVNGGDGGSGVVILRYNLMMLDLNAKTGTPSTGTWTDSTTATNITTPNSAGNTFPSWSATNKFFAFNGSNHIYKNTIYSNPGTFSIEVWFRTTSSGAKIIGFQNAAGNGSGTSAYDRHIYIDNTGKLRFGLYNGGGFNYVTSSGAINDGNWHHAIATYSNGTANLYIDGTAQTATTGINTATQNYSGYWVIGGGRLASWTALDNNGINAAGWTGDLAVARVYGYEVSSSEVTTLRTQAANAQQVTVTFDANTGSGSMSAQQITYNTATALTSNSFTKNEHTFSGWATSAGGAVMYSNGAQITLLTDTTLYAKYELNACSPSSTSSGGVTTLSFTTVGSCNWTVPVGVSSAEVLIVGGGGGGGGSTTNRTGGSGGAGGYFYNENVSISGVIAIGVGSGGTGSTTRSNRGASGGDSFVGTLKVGGGGGGVGDQDTTNERALTGRGGSDYVSSGNGGGGRARFADGVASNPTLGGLAGAFAASGISFLNNTYIGTQGVSGGSGISDNASGGLGGQITQASRTSAISGSSVVYAKRGTYLPWDNGSNTDRPQTYGSGGAANYLYGGTTTGAGGAGAQGVVIIKYANATRTITYALNSGSGTAPTQNAVSDGATFTVASASGVNRSGFVFRGWSDGTTTYQSGATYTVGANNITLTAVWQSLNQRISYNLSDINSYDSTVNTTVTDLSGSNRNGTLTGSGTSIGTNGAMMFPGGLSSSGPFIDVPDISTTGFNTNGITIDFEANFGNIDVWERIIDFGVTGERSSNLLVGRIGNETNVGVEVYNGITSLGICKTGILTGLIRYTIVLDGTNCHIYRTGQATYTTAFTAKPVANQTWTSNFIGKSNWSADASFAGELRSVRIFEGVFTPTEIGAFNYKTVTFDTTTGGTATPTSKTTSGTIKLASLSRSGFSPNGWFTASSGGSKIGDVGASYTPTSDVTLFSQWTANLSITTPSSGLSGTVGTPYSLTLSTAGGSGGNDFTVTSGSLPAGLSLNSATGVISGTPTTVGSSSAVITVTDSGNRTAATSSFTITISAATLSNAGTPTVSATSATLKSIDVSWNAVANASSYTIRIYASNGTTLRQTLTGLTGTSKTITASDFAAIADNTIYQISLTAIGTGNYATSSESSKASVTTNATYTVTYNYNEATGGNSTPSNSFIPGQAGITLPIPTRTHFTFGGWFDNAGFLGNAYTSPFSPTASITLFAKWTVNTFNITLNKGSNGIGSDRTLVKTATETLTLPNSATANSYFTRTGFTVTGWSTTDGGAQTHALAGAFNTNATTTLYPVWTGNALNPTFGTPTATASGFTVQITNYDNAYTWAGTATASGTVSISGTGLVTVTGVAGNTSSTVTITTARTGYAGGSNTVAETSFRTADAFFDATTYVPSSTTWINSVQGGTNGTTSTGGLTKASTPTAVRFTGKQASNSNRVTGTIGSLTGVTAVTVEMYVKLLDSGNVQNAGGSMLFSWGSASGAGNYNIYHRASQLGFNTFNSELYGINSSAIEGTWAHLVFVMSTQGTQTSQKIYLNGVLQNLSWLVNSSHGTRAFNANGNFVLMDNDRSANTWNAMADLAYAKVYKGELTQAQVTSAYQNRTNTGNSFTVVYEYDGATGNNSTTSDSFTTGGTAITLPTPTKTGYSFAGWYAEAGLTTLVGNGGDTYSPTDSVRLYAKWAVDAYTVTYDYNNATGGNGTATSSFTIGGSGITLPTPTKTGHTFAGWYEASNFSGSALTSPYSPTQSRTIYAKWTADTYTVTYNYNSATGGNGTATSSFTFGGTAITLPIPTRTGFTFAGWFEAQDFSGSALGSTYSPTQSRTIYAKWTANSLTLTFHKNDNSGTTSTQSITAGTATALTSNSFTRTGYTFAGWSANSNGTGTQYTNGESVTLLVATNFYAKWTANTLTVTFHRNDGSGNTATQSITAGTATALTSNSFTRTGYTFSGWTANSDGTGTSYGDGESVTIFSNLPLYAKWTAISYTVTYNTNGATGSAPTQANRTIGQTFTVAAATGLTRTGYTFGGWSDGTTTFQPNATFTVGSSNVTLIAQWNVDTYTITYSANNGTGSAARTTDSYIFGSAAIVLPGRGSLARAGYSFAGWSETSGGSAISGSYTPTQTRTLFAVWSPNTYTITYNSNGATGSPSVSSENYTTGNAGSNLAGQGTMTKLGHDFAGWATSAGATANDIVSTPYTTTSSLTLYAVWSPIGYTVDFNLAGGNSSLPTESAKNFNQTFTLPAAATRAPNSSPAFSWAFVAWCSSAVVNGLCPDADQYQAGSTFRMGTANIEFTAVWIRVFTVKYTMNGASTAAPADVFSSDGASVTLANAPVRAGYSFTGWRDQSGQTYSAGATMVVDLDSYLVYAQWSPINYAISYLLNGGTSAQPAGATRNIGDVVTVAAAPTRAGFRFNGWSYNSQLYGAGASVIVGITDITFSASWSAIDYNVTYDMNGSTTTRPTVSSKRIGQTFALAAAPSRAGYTFAGWSDGVETKNAGATYTVGSSDITLAATWTPVNYTLTYDVNGGNSSAPTGANNLNIGNTFTVAAAPSHQNRTFLGWSDGTNTYTAGQTYTVGSSNVTLSAMWSGVNYNIVYDLNGGSGTTPTESAKEAGQSITVKSDNGFSRPNYTFAGWKNGNQAVAPNQSLSVGSSDITLVAQWTPAFTVSFAANGGSATSNLTFTGTALARPTNPTRANFVFEGWTDNGNDVSWPLTPTGPVNLQARWTQLSLYGLNPSDLARFGQLTARTGVAASFTGSNTDSSVAVNVPAGSLPEGTTINIDLVGNTARAQALIPATNSYLVSFVVSWLATDGTVPLTAANKPISMTITNAQIKAGAVIYSVIGDSYTILGRATQDGTVTIEITEDPEILVAATKPDAPTNVTGTSTAATNLTASWSAPAINGGATITGYTATTNTGQSCTTSTLSCTINGLTAATSYTVTVIATNSIGNSVLSSPSAQITTAAAQNNGGGNQGGGNQGGGNQGGGSGGGNQGGGSGGSGNSGGGSTPIKETPAKPVLQTGDGKPVVPASGGGKRIVDGVIKTELVRVIEKQIVRTEFSSVAIEVKAVANNNTVKDLKENTTLVFEQAGKASLTGSGFRPVTTVKVWIFSEPTYLGEAEVKSDGSFDAALLIPANFPVGNHTLQINGVTNSNEVVTQTFGVVVEAKPTTPVPETPKAVKKLVLNLALAPTQSTPTKAQLAKTTRLASSVVPGAVITCKSFVTNKPATKAQIAQASRIASALCAPIVKNSEVKVKFNRTAPKNAASLPNAKTKPVRVQVLVKAIPN